MTQVNLFKLFQFFMSLVLSLILLLCGNVNAIELRSYESPSSITVMSSSSLANVITEVMKIYSNDKNISMIGIYDSADELKYAITEGDNVDVFISEHHDTFRDLQRMGVLNISSIIDLMGNNLSLVASKKNRLSELSHLSGGNSGSGEVVKVLNRMMQKTLITIGDPESTWLGHITKKYMVDIGKWRAFKPYVIRAASARNALYLIDKAQSVGVVYKTDALSNDGLKILANLYDDVADKRPPVIYQAAIVAGDNIEQASGFMKFLRSDKVREIFKKYGFVDISLADSVSDM